MRRKSRTHEARRGRITIRAREARGSTRTARALAASLALAALALATAASAAEDPTSDPTGVATDPYAGSEAQLEDARELTNEPLDTDHTPDAKPSELWTQVGGGMYPDGSARAGDGSRLVEGSPTPFDVDCSRAAASHQGYGAACGIERPSACARHATSTGEPDAKVVGTATSEVEVTNISRHRRQRHGSRRRNRLTRLGKPDRRALGDTPCVRSRPMALYVAHPSSHAHDTGAHPENAGRLRAIEAALDDAPGLNLERAPAPAAARGQLERVHSPAHVDAIEALSARGGGMTDPDTVVSPGSFEAALHSAGGAAWAAERLLAGEHRAAFCGLRPPGHHAERERAMGFCLFNNVAVAAAHAIAECGAERVIVLDWDVHHGNGTEAIFTSSAQVLYASIHQWPHYPGTGPAEYSGEGRARALRSTCRSRRAPGRTSSWRSCSTSRSRSREPSSRS